MRLSRTLLGGETPDAGAMKETFLFLGSIASARLSRGLVYIRRSTLDALEASSNSNFRMAYMWRHLLSVTYGASFWPSIPIVKGRLLIAANFCPIRYGALFTRSGCAMSRLNFFGLRNSAGTVVVSGVYRLPSWVLWRPLRCTCWCVVIRVLKRNSRSSSHGTVASTGGYFILSLAPALDGMTSAHQFMHVATMSSLTLFNRHQRYLPVCYNCGSRSPRMKYSLGYSPCTGRRKPDGLDQLRSLRVSARPI